MDLSKIFKLNLKKLLNKLAMDIFNAIAIFTISLAFLIKSSDYFVNFAEKIGKKIKIPHFIIGIVIIGFGTSLPEFSTSITSAIKSTKETDLSTIITSNIIGSNIANTLLVVSVASFFSVIKVKRDLLDTDLPFLFGATALSLFFLYDGLLTWKEGIIIFAVFCVYILFSIFDKDSSQVEDQIHQEKKIIGKVRKSTFKLSLLLLISAAAIIISSNYTVLGIEKISTALNLKKGIISIVFLSIGTSLPEIFVSISAIRKGYFLIAIGNIFGSNIINLVGVLSIASFIHPLSVSQESIYIGLPFLAFSTLFFIFITLDNRIRIWEGLISLVMFFAFLGKIFNIL
ncbi:MAG: calcium/sodium antiporter [Minisyncoccales bacterium]